MLPPNIIVLAPLLWIALAVALSVALVVALAVELPVSVPISPTGVVAVLICPLEVGPKMN